MKNRSVRTQLSRYAVVGIVSNAMLYAIYLVLTHFGIEPKLAMTATFVVGVTQTFMLNRSWTFSYRGSNSRAYARYWVAYGVAYGVNFLLLVVLVDKLGFRHEIVQGVLILAIAVLLFAAQRLWIFRPLPCKD